MMKYALIGCGRISPNHIASAIDNNLQIVGISDIVSCRMVELADKFKLDNVNMYEDYTVMLQEQRPELVAIATESGEHAKIAINCINHGCNVIIEKPIALSLQDADTIINTAKKVGVKVCACHQNRFNKSVRKIKEAIDNKRFGKMFYGTAHIRWNRGEEYYKQALWRGTYEQDGGALMNQCIHNIDLLRWLMGDNIDRVIGCTRNFNHPYIEAEDFGMAIVMFSNGSIGLVEGTTSIFPKNLEETLYLFGETGTVKAGGKSVNVIEEWSFKDGLDSLSEVKSYTDETPPNVYGFGHKPLYQDVIAAIKEDRNPYVDAAAGRRALELVLAIYKAASSGETIPFPLENCSTVDFKK